MTAKNSSLDPITQSLKIQNHIFPGIWRYMLPAEFLQMDFPDERRATCMDCPKSCFENYRPDYRCCTYFPRIPNFLLGLATRTEEGALMVKQILAQGYVTPEGMNSTPHQWIDYLDDLEHDQFGSSEKVLCPMLNRSNGFCMVHAFRNSVCSTFFCYKDHGDKGEDFWAKVQTLGSQVEMALAQWAMGELGFDIKQYTKSVDGLAKTIDSVADKKSKGWAKTAQKVMWGDWYGREFEFLQECGNLASDYRDSLWDIANQTEIYESKKFDRAMVKLVPKRLKDQLDPSDLEESGDTISPQALWSACRKSYQKLWQVTPRKYVLSRKIKLVENNQLDDKSRKFASSPYVIEVYKKQDLEDRVFISQHQYEILLTFEKPQVMSWKLMTDLFQGNYKADKKFIGEMIGQKFLVVRSQ